MEEDAATSQIIPDITSRLSSRLLVGGGTQSGMPLNRHTRQPLALGASIKLPRADKPRKQLDFIVKHLRQMVDHYPALTLDHLRRHNAMLWKTTCILLDTASGSAPAGLAPHRLLKDFMIKGSPPSAPPAPASVSAPAAADKIEVFAAKPDEQASETRHEAPTAPVAKPTAAMPVGRSSGKELESGKSLSFPASMPRSTAALHYIEDLIGEYPGLTWRHILRHNKSLYHNVMPQLYQLNDQGHAFSTAQLKAEDLAAVRGERSIPAGASLLWEVQAAKNPSAFRIVQPVPQRKPRDTPPAAAVEEPVATQSKEYALSSPSDTLTDMLAFARNEATPTSGMTVAELGQRRPAYRLIFERWMDKLKTPEELRIGNDDPLTSKALNLLVLRGKALSRLATVEMFSDRKDRSETQATFLRRTFKESSPEPGLTVTDLVPLQRFAEIGVLTLDDVNRHQAADREWTPMKAPKSLEAAVPSVRLLSPLVDMPRLQQPA